MNKLLSYKEQNSKKMKGSMKHAKIEGKHYLLENRKHNDKKKIYTLKTKGQMSSKD